MGDRQIVSPAPWFVLMRRRRRGLDLVQSWGYGMMCVLYGLLIHGDF